MSDPNYAAKYGTQQEQAARQASIGTSACDGPWRLTRTPRMGLEAVILDNSVRSTRREAEALQAAQKRATGIDWAIERYE